MEKTYTMTIGEIISRIRITNKLQNADVRMTDRVIYNQMLTARDVLIKNEDDKKALLKMAFLFKKLNRVDLIEIDNVEACGIESGCTLMRSRDRLPKILTATFGEIIKSITSLDGKIDMSPTSRKSFNRKVESKNHKYDKDYYFFIEDGYLYLPNVTWDAVSVFAFFEDPALIDYLNACYEDEPIICTPMKERDFACPAYLIKYVIDQTAEEISRLYNRLREDVLMNKNPNT